MRRFICFVSAVIICAVMLCVPAFADGKATAFVVDDAGAFSSMDIKEIKAAADAAVEKTGFSIVIFTSDNVGPDKSDSAVTDFADLKYEELCGMNTDGILLFINFDNKYDRISTSGSCINYFSDYRIDSMWTVMDRYFEKDDFKGVALSFIRQIESYYGQGKANNQQEILGREVDVDEAAGTFFSSFMFTGFFALIASIIMYSAFSKPYKTERPETRNYTLKDSLYFTVRSDRFVGNFTSRIYSPRSTSSGGHSSGGHSHHSSTHHSSSGGRHGGGGHHR